MQGSRIVKATYIKTLSQNTKNKQAKQTSPDLLKSHRSENYSLLDIVQAPVDARGHLGGGVRFSSTTGVPGIELRSSDIFTI